MTEPASRPSGDDREHTYPPHSLLPRDVKDRHNLGEVFSGIRRAFGEFLLIPTLIILGFLLLSVGSYILDRYASVNPSWLGEIHQALVQHVFSNYQATTSLLSTIAGGLITLTSITFSLLLIAVQQSASTLSSQVYDQFLRRSQNQAYFGFFVGLALYALITLATISSQFNPVIGASLVFLLTIVALYILVLLIYSTINQMRPSMIIEAIHDHILIAHEQQIPLYRLTRRKANPTPPSSEKVPVKTPYHGYVTGIDVLPIGKAVKQNKGIYEVNLLITIGSNVSFEKVIAEVSAENEQAAKPIIQVIQQAVQVDPSRDIHTDADYGVFELGMIAWTSISTSKSNPAPALMAIHSLHDILVRWSLTSEPSGEDAYPVVYSDDPVEMVLDTFESLTVAASSSKQHQTLAAIFRTLASVYDQLPAGKRERVNALILRAIPTLKDHYLTLELNLSITALIQALQDAHHTQTAQKLKAAQDELAQTVGSLSGDSPQK